MELKKMREKIDAFDEKILGLLNRRAREVLRISEFKKSREIAGYAPEREALILKNLNKKNKGPLTSRDIDTIFSDIMVVCRSLRGAPRVAYFGPRGTFTHMAAIKKFGKKPECLPCDSITDVFEILARDEADYGVVPIENSTEGVVRHTLDMFFTSRLKICAQVTLNISHFLLGRTSIDKIKKIYSYPQVFAQCRNWIAANMRGVELVDSASTAAAAILAAGDRESACIGNKMLAEIYKLRIISASIEDSAHNYTRFLVIARHDSRPCGKDKTSILLGIKDKVGALHDVLASFRRRGINLTKIESRPSKEKPWEYCFFMDFKGHRNCARVNKLLKDLGCGCTFVKILGSYPEE